MLMKRAELRQLFYLLIVCHLEHDFLPGGKSAIQIVKIGVAQLDLFLSCHPTHSVTFTVKDNFGGFICWQLIQVSISTVVQRQEVSICRRLRFRWRKLQQGIVKRIADPYASLRIDGNPAGNTNQDGIIIAAP